MINEDEPLVGVEAENWIKTELTVSNALYVNNTGRTQFRIYFTHLDKVDDTAVGWYSGNSLDNEPQLLVRYAELE